MARLTALVLALAAAGAQGLALRRPTFVPGAASRSRLFQARANLRVVTAPNAAALEVDVPAAVSKYEQFNTWAAEKGAALKDNFSGLCAAGKESGNPLVRVAKYSQAMAVYSVFLLYRSYRGFGVILPAVFQEVNAKLQEGVAVKDEGVSNDVNAKGQLKLRSQILISIGAVVYTSLVLARFTVDGAIGLIKGIVKGLLGVIGIGRKKKQNFLEAEPYWDQSTIPVNTYKAKSPFIGKVRSVKRIVGENATGETCHIVIDHEGKMPYWEGQSWGVIPPGTNPKNGKPHSVRLYSIASTRYGDDMTGKTGSLCVRRAVYWDPEMGAEDPAKKGICSNFLCDAAPGTELTMTGPSGKVMLMPEEDPETDLIMVATGTGIAPYRGFIRRLFTEATPAAAAYKGEAWLFLGVANKDSLLYDDEFSAVLKEYPENFRYDLALSREQTNAKGGKMYIQDKMEEYADEIFSKLDKGAHIYFCGLKGMMPGIQDMLKGVAEAKGIDYDEWMKGLKAKKQWHVEVY